MGRSFSRGAGAERLRHRVRLGARCAALSLAAAPAAHAQSFTARALPGGLARAVRDSASRVGEMVTVRAVPKEFTIASVPVPSQLPTNQPVTFTVRALGGASIISRMHGTLAPSADARVLLLTFGVPARAPAGPAAVAEVMFESPDGQRLPVTLTVEVTPVHAITIDLIQQAIGTRPGAKIALRYRVTNQGNTVDTVKVGFDLPYDWRVRDAEQAAVVVPRNSSVTQQTTVDVPVTANTGSFSVQLQARDEAGAVAVERLYAEIPANRQLPTTRAIAVSTSISSTTGSAGGGSALMGISFAGTLFRDVELAMDATSAPALTERGRYRLASLGQFPQPPNFLLSAGPARLRIGGVGVSFSELTGAGAGGRGVSLGWESPTLSIKSAFAGNGLGFGSPSAATATDELSGPSLETPVVAGARVSTLVSPDLWVTGTVAHLDEGDVLFGRKLDVAGIGALMPTVFGGTLESEVALRRYAGGSGLGLFSEFTRTSARERVQLRVVSAPGGAQAFAGADRSLSGYLSHELSPSWQLGTQAWYTQNRGTLGETARSIGGGVTPQHSFTNAFSLGVDVGGSTQSLDAAGASFNTQEQHLSTIFNYLLGAQTAMSVTTTAARVGRGVAFDSLAPVSDLASHRGTVTGQLSRSTAHFGTLLVTAQASRDEAYSVGFPRQDQVSMRLDRFPLLFPGATQLYATGLVQRLGWFGDRPSVTTLRGELTAELPWGVAVSFAADRNPLVSVEGAGPWSTALRISRTNYLTVPSFLRPGSRKGVVYQDLNGDGIQNPGEPGMEGVIVRRGDQYVITDERGTFAFADAHEPHTERLTIDPRTLPAGWMERSSPTSEAAGRLVRAIGVIPTSTVRLHFVTKREDLGTAGGIDLTRIVVTARDSLGRTYLAQSVDSATQAFAALPPGTYQVSVDPSSAGAQLQVTQAPDGFRVGAERGGHDYEIVLATRGVKLKTFGPTAPATPVPMTPAPRSPASPPERQR
jgi:hypothetical protein